MKHIFSLLFAIVFSLVSTAQVDIDKSVNLSGGAGDRSITNLELPANDNDAASKKYVDDQIAANSGGGFTHYIGQLFGGGVVAEVYKDGGDEHGLVVSLINNSTGSTWSNVSSTVVGAGGQRLTDGATNTESIIGQGGHTSSAAKICADYNDGSNSDWYLPAFDELGLICDNRSTINKALTNGGAERIDLDWYWSSSETSNNSAWSIAFNNGNLNSPNTSKGTSYLVRCVRAY